MGYIYGLDRLTVGGDPRDFSRVLPVCIACSVVIFVVLQKQGKQSGDDDDVRNIPIFFKRGRSKLLLLYCVLFAVEEKYEN